MKEMFKLKDVTPRIYQQTIFAKAVNSNTLIVLPTGLGKTLIFLMVAIHRLSTYPKSKVVLTGPTRPLIEQYMSVFLEKSTINKEDMAVFTGMVDPEERARLWQKSRVIFTTPQALENDIISGRVTLEEVSLLGIDEAHRSVGNYSTVFIAKEYLRKARWPRIIGMTASPGSDKEKIKEVCANLGIEEIEIRDEEDSDVKEYVQGISVKWEDVELTSDLKAVSRILKRMVKARVDKIRNYGIKTSSLSSKTGILQLQRQIMAEVSQGNKDYQNLKAVSLLSEIIKIQHADELLETQGVFSLSNYLSRIEESAPSSRVKAVKNLVADPDFRVLADFVRELREKGVEHPKRAVLRRIVQEGLKEGMERIIVFNNYRDNASSIVEMLNKLEGVKAALFVGQQKRNGTGITQKEQIRILRDFKEGKYNVVVMTSVGEEGLDIPEVDIVIFYEPIPSAIRQIQRRGRTGRQKKGRVVIISTKNTRDEAYRWSAYNKEKRMKRVMTSVRKELPSLPVAKEKPLTEFRREENLFIYVDSREKNSPLLKELISREVKVELTRMEVSDYAISSRVAVEYKTVKDFVDSIIDGRLLEQAKKLREAFERPVIIIEGKEDIYSVRNVHMNAIQGMIATIVLSFGIPLIRTVSPAESAGIIIAMARREQEASSQSYSPHALKPRSMAEQVFYVVSSLPGIGGMLARPLLKRFGSIRRIVNADEEELKEVGLIGEKKAQKLRKLFEYDYAKEGKRQTG